jgi:hypothetical protein
MSSQYKKSKIEIATAKAKIERRTIAIKRAVVRQDVIVPPVSFRLATFCWKKSLLCNDDFYTGIRFYSESTLQL